MGQGPGTRNKDHVTCARDTRPWPEIKNQGPGARDQGQQNIARARARDKRPGAKEKGQARKQGPGQEPGPRDRGQGPSPKKTWWRDPNGRAQG